MTDRECPDDDDDYFGPEPPGNRETMIQFAVQEFVGDAFFPAGKTDLIRFALSRNASEEVIVFLRRLTDREYTNAEDVVREAERLA